MIIEMTNDYRIQGTPESWNVQFNAAAKKSGEPRWENMGYYVCLESAVAYLSDQLVREIPDSATKDEVVKALSEIRRLVNEALVPFKMAV
jgi:hypothetical protein